MLKNKNIFTDALPADPVLENSRRQVMKACYSFVSPRRPGRPGLVHVSEEMLKALGMTSADAQSDDFLRVFSGSQVPPNARPYAMCYGGHQFGSWAGQLGDGRAINLGQVEAGGRQWTLQLKGAGKTPYSRSADGLAVLRSSIREHLCSEAMYHLGVPTTRSLSLMLSGDLVLRDVLYDGNPEYEKGAIVCRVANSFIRFGNFEIFAARNDIETLKKLADFTIEQHYPEIKSNSKEKYISFFNAVLDRTLEMIVHWQRVGFVHGVMNTDNMSILGQTIDYGPYGWLEGYDPGWTPNTTDRQSRRYRFGHQPRIALWNLLQLANALFPLVKDAKPFERILNSFPKKYQGSYTNMMRKKLGLKDKENPEDALIGRLEKNLQLTETDMTIFFRNLAHFSPTHSIEAFCNSPALKDAYYSPNNISENVMQQWKTWFRAYQLRLQEEDVPEADRKHAMNQSNPKYVLRNYMAQLAIDGADKNDYSLINELYSFLRRPYEEQPEAERWFARRPEWARHKVGCSMLSCSS